MDINTVYSIVFITAKISSPHNNQTSLVFLLAAFSCKYVVNCTYSTSNTYQIDRLRLRSLLRSFRSCLISARLFKDSPIGGLDV